MPRPMIPTERIIAERFARHDSCPACRRTRRRLKELHDRLDAILTDLETDHEI